MKSRKLTPAQLRRFRFFRERGFGIAEARRLARLTYNQMATELSRRLHKLSESQS